MGEAASKAGTLLNFAVGGEGRGYTDAEGNFIPRRRPRTDILPRLRQSPLFPGDALVDELPTLTDIYEFAVGQSQPGVASCRPLARCCATGRLDALDSVARNAPGVIGAAFNNRLLLGGFAGEPDARPAASTRSAFGAGKRGALAARRAPDAGVPVRRTAEVRDLSEALPGRVSRGGRPGRRARAT